MKQINWPVAVLLGVVVLFLLFGAGMLSGWGYRGWGMMGRPMMGGWGFAPFGWLGMFFMWLIPVGFLVLLVLGIAWLVRSLGGPTPPPAAHACPNCGRGVQADWSNCPYCGTSLK